MNDVDPRYFYWIVWGIGTVIVYLLLFLRARRHYRQHHDARARRDQLRAFGYFLVAIAAAIGITFALFARGLGIAGVLFAVSSAVFSVVGLYALLDREPDNGNREARRM